MGRFMIHKPTRTRCRALDRPGASKQFREMELAEIQIHEGRGKTHRYRDTACTASGTPFRHREKTSRGSSVVSKTD
jgi:hypothetical protein